MVNPVKRKSLKTIAGAFVAVGAVSFSPLSFSRIENKQADAALSFTHVETVFGRTVFIKNHSDEAVKLEKLRSGVISSPSGDYDLNRLLEHRSQKEGGLTISPASTQAYNIADDGRILNWGDWKTTPFKFKAVATNERVRPVNIYTHDKLLSDTPRLVVEDGLFIS